LPYQQLREDSLGVMDIDRTKHGLTELRVHGVSGTPPSAMLKHPQALVRLVEGSDTAGFYRRWYPGGTTEDTPDRRHLEAYGWGGLTSGPASRALWMLLLPFTLVNLAHWMLPQHRKSRLGATSVTLLRLLGLSLTLTMMLSVAEMTMDLAAWQCAAMTSCANRMGLLSGAHSWAPGARVAVGALFPALLIGLLWRLGRSGASTDALSAPPPPSVALGEVPLTKASFWHRDLSTRRLRAAHITAWASGLAILTLVAPARYGVGDQARLAARLLLGVNAAVLAVAIALVASSLATARGGPSAQNLDGPANQLRKVSLVLLAVSIVATARIGLALHGPFAPSYLPGLHGFVTAMLLSQAVLLVGVTVCVGAQRPWQVGEEHAGYRVAAAGFGAPLTAILSWLVAGAVSTGLGLWLARFLGQPVPTTKEAISEYEVLDRLAAGHGPSFADNVAALTAPHPLILPPPYFWAGTAAVFVLITSVIAAGIVVWRVRLRPAQQVQDVLDEHHRFAPRPVPDPPSEVARWVVGRRRLARITDYVDRILAAIAATACLVMVYGAVSYRLSPHPMETASRFVQLSVPGIVLIASSAAGIVSLAFLAFRDPAIRRYVGIIWDIATFLPRANHPLTPPCYGEHAVPQLIDRLRQLTTQEGDVVVLSGHSQGSVIAAAVMLQLDPATVARTGLLTYGSPLRRLYARFFPAYFGWAAMDAVRTTTAPCWRNLWVPSDPIGAWQFDPSSKDGVDRALDDPAHLELTPTGGHPVLVLHSGYFERPELGENTDQVAACRLPH